MVQCGTIQVGSPSLYLDTISRNDRIAYGNNKGIGFTVNKADGTSQVSKPSKKVLFTHKIVLKMNTRLKSTLMPVKPSPFRTTQGDLVLKIILDMWNGICFQIT